MSESTEEGQTAKYETKGWGMNLVKPVGWRALQAEESSKGTRMEQSEGQEDEICGRLYKRFVTAAGWNRDGQENEAGHLKWVHFIVYKLYLNRDHFKCKIMEYF